MLRDYMLSVMLEAHDASPMLKEARCTTLGAAGLGIAAQWSS